MTWPWPIFSSALAVFCLGFPLRASSVSGLVQLADSRESSVLRHQDYSGVVVWLEPASAPLRLPARHAEMTQKDKRFTPHVLAVSEGSTVDFPNFDPIFHNAFSNFSGQLFDVGLYPPGTSRSVTFRRAGVVRVFCNIHPTMSAVIVVLKTPYYAVTKPSGAFGIPDVPAGEYQLHVFHERASPARLKSLERRVPVNSSPLNLGTLVISESGYVEVPHKNKYDQDYPPVIDDRPLYPGTSK